MITDSKDEYKMANCLAETAGAKALIQSVSDKTGIPVEELNGEKAFSLANQGNEKAIAGIPLSKASIAAPTVPEYNISAPTL